MKFTQYDMGHCQAGEIVEVTLSGSAANVRLMDRSNFGKYKLGARHTYYGGLAKRSPLRMEVPRSGHWFVTVDMQGLRGTVRSSARKLPGRLPEITNRPLTSVPSLVQDNFPPATIAGAEHFDVFISHASDDKEEVVRSLANELEARGLRVWYDEFTLRIGDSLRQKIDHGLRNSRVGLVVISPSFIEKGWTNYELDGIVSRAVSGEQILLPIWHRVTKQQVIDFSPSLADKVARSTATHTTADIALEIAELLQARS